MFLYLRGKYQKVNFIEFQKINNYGYYDKKKFFHLFFFHNIASYNCMNRKCYKCFKALNAFFFNYNFIKIS